MSSTTLSVQHFRSIAIVACVAMMTFFDYGIAFYLTEIIATNFFGGHEIFWLSLVQSIGLFVGAYASHPIGGFLLGQYGDINGRRAVMFLGLLGLTVFTLIMAFLPTYAHIGIVAPILFVLARFGQGLAYGGQIPSVLVFITEQIPMRHVGFGCGVLVAGTLAGLLFMSFLIAFLENTLSYADMLSYGWRVPFLIGGVLSAGLLCTFKFLVEIPIDEQMDERHAEEEHTLSAMSFDGLTQIQIQSLVQNNIFHDDKNNNKLSFMQILTKNRPVSLMLAVLVSWLMLSIFMVIAVMLPTFIDINFTIDDDILMFGSGISLLFMMIGSVFYGYLADRMNTGKVMIIGGILLIIQTSLFFAQLQLGSELMLLWFALLGFSGGVVATLPAVLTRLFPSKIRLTSIALTHNIIYVLVAGVLPNLLSTATFHLPLASALYLLLVGLLTIFSSFYIYYLPRSERDITR